MKTYYRYVIHTINGEQGLKDNQSAIPTFDGLFPDEDDKSVKNLLFILATWHAYAKLHLHTDTTLRMFEEVSTALCQALRHFATVTCPCYATKELPWDVDARVTWQQSQATCSRGANRKSNKTGKVKRFSMNTYKIHCIPDYPNAIRKYGTTDSYSTQTVSLSILPIQTFLK